MGICGGGTDTVNTTQTTRLPAWVEAAGQSLFQTAQPLAERSYPFYSGDRVASFSPNQEAAFGLASSNVGGWEGAFNNAFTGYGAAADQFSAGDLDKYINPYIKDVQQTTIAESNRQWNRDQILRNAEMVNRGSYLNEDRREVIDNLSRESRDRINAEMVALTNAGAFNTALGAREDELSRLFNSSAGYAQLAPLFQDLGNIDVATMLGIGGQQQAQEQGELNLSFDEFLRQFYYPQEQTNWLLGGLAGTPYGQTTNAQVPVGSSNPLGGLLGAGAAIAGIGGPSGFNIWP